MNKTNIGLKEVNIWIINLVNYFNQKQRLDKLYNLLTYDEDQYANKFYNKNHKITFIIVRGILRELISYYTGISSNALRFKYNKHGKPYLLRNCKQNNLYFNVSHSGDHALLIFALNQEVGIDIEHVRHFENFQSVAKQFYSSIEYSRLALLPTHLKLPYFYQIWTRKEALVKGIGKGLLFPLNQVDVVSKAIGGAILPIIKNSIIKSTEWYIFDINIYNEYTSSFAVNGLFDKVILRNYQ